jgi:hypothetical protein
VLVVLVVVEVPDVEKLVELVVVDEKGGVDVVVVTEVTVKKPSTLCEPASETKVAPTARDSTSSRESHRLDDLRGFNQTTSAEPTARELLKLPIIRNRPSTATG